MNATEVLENLRDELDSTWSDTHGGFSDFFVRALVPGDSNLRDYLRMISKDGHTTPQARSLATRALEEVESDANFLGQCGIAQEDLGDIT